MDNIAIIEQRINELVGEVLYHNEMYHEKNTPEISDAEFDSMVEDLNELIIELIDICPESDAITKAQEALDNVGAEPSYGKRVKHQQVMGSLSKTTTIEGVKEWYNKYAPKGGCKILVMPKIDGCACRLNYEKGKLIEGATRGNGYIGMDVTDNVKVIDNIPKNFPLSCEVRGEIVMKRSIFNKLRNNGLNFANPRNAGTGSLRQQDPNITKNRELSFMLYDIISDSINVTTEAWKHHILGNKYGAFEMVEHEAIDIDDLEETVKKWEERRPNLDYEIDGLVLCIDDLQAQENAGWNGKRPRGRIAFKFKPEQVKAKVIDIDLQVGRTGRLTPMARLVPTLLSGSTIQNVTLHNYNNVYRLNIAPLDEVLIEKAGDIIPQVVRVVSNTDQRPGFVFPVTCPSCGGATTLDARGVNLWCYNPSCPAQLERKVLFWVKTLDLKGIGKGIIRKLCENGYIKELPDLYNVTTQQLINVTGGSRAAEKAEEAIHSKKDIPLEVFLDALGINGLGTTTSKAVAKKFFKLAYVRGANTLDFESMDDIGEITALNIVTGLADLEDIIDKLLKVINVEDKKVASGPLLGLKFVLTGSMNKSRSLITKEIEEAGGEVKSSVGRGVNYLVQADPSEESSKAKKAKSLGTQIISEEQLYGMM
jgi:DNA ligase (NAD+)